MILPIWLSQTHTQATIGYRGGLLAPECCVQHADDPGELTALTAFEAEKREAMIAKRGSMAHGMWDSYRVLTLRR